MLPKTKKLETTVEQINEKHGEETVVTANELSEKDKTPTETSGPDNSCYTNFSSAGKDIIAQKEEICQESVFKVLSNVNVNEKVEFKGKMRYLSWAFAWGEVKKLYPDMTSKVYETENGMNYFTDGKTCFVKVGVTIEGLEHIEYYPVTNNYNKSILVGQVTSFDINAAIQRGLTKAIARHGLGLYIYAGEDLPEQEEKTDPTKELEELILSLDEETSKKYLSAILEKYRIYNLNELPQKTVEILIERLKEKEVKTA